MRKIKASTNFAKKSDLVSNIIYSLRYSFLSTSNIWVYRAILRDRGVIIKGCVKNVWHETKGVEIVLHCAWRQKIQYLINTFFVFLCFLWNENNLFFVIWRRNTFPPTFTSKTCFLECKPYIRSFQQFCRPTPVKLHRRLLHLNYIFLSKNITL